MSSIADTGDSVLARLDESKITRLHWKIMFISGMGFFTDAYDLFIIGVVMSLLKAEWHISAGRGRIGDIDRAVGVGGGCRCFRADRRHARPQTHLWL